MITKP